MKSRGLPEQIAETIVSDVILPRSLAPGDQLPTVRELQQKFEVSTSTIAAALDV
ncbi:MAG: GntR family transcriptional regulator, partial [Verrucomicrobia bacterium]|nr:GntR family transcriptional regulator [Verrucomicrobiota bacterium]